MDVPRRTFAQQRPMSTVVKASIGALVVCLFILLIVYRNLQNQISDEQEIHLMIARSLKDSLEREENKGHEMARRLQIYKEEIKTLQEDFEKYKDDVVRLEQQLEVKHQNLVIKDKVIGDLTKEAEQLSYNLEGKSQENEKLNQQVYTLQRENEVLNENSNNLKSKFYLLQEVNGRLEGENKKNKEDLMANMPRILTSLNKNDRRTSQIQGVDLNKREISDTLSISSNENSFNFQKQEAIRSKNDTLPFGKFKEFNSLLQRKRRPAEENEQQKKQIKSQVEVNEKIISIQKLNSGGQTNTNHEQKQHLDDNGYSGRERKELQENNENNGGPGQKGKQVDSEVRAETLLEITSNTEVYAPNYENNITEPTENQDFQLNEPQSLELMN